MLSYQHIYHAGNFADVQKHAILIRLLKSLVAKPQRLQVLDTHAGRGLYDLTADEALKTSEFKSGIEAIFEKETRAPALADYFAMLQKFNPEGGFNTYPGTAAIAHDMLRPSDKLTCIEKHPGEFAKLQDCLPDVDCKLKDGFEAITETTTTSDRRMVMLIDPSYELKNEYLDLPRFIEKAWKKSPQTIFMIWYPMLETLGHRHMLAALRATSVKDILVSEIRLDKPPAEHFRMYGTGIALINPPFPEKPLEDITNAVAKSLPMKAFADVFWLDNKHLNPETGMLEI